MTTYVFANNVNTTLASAASSSATTLTLSSSANLPTLSAGQIMPLTLNDAATGAVYEVVYVTAISGATLTVTRAQEGTGAQNWSVGDYAFSTATAGTAAVTTGDPTKTFQVGNGTLSEHAVNLGQFSGALVSNSYTRLPNGLIIQWGTPSGTSPVTATWPIPFPNALLSCVAMPSTNNNSTYGINFTSGDNTNGVFYPNSGGTGVALTFYYIAIGH